MPLVASLLVLLMTTVAAAAEPVPLPSVDYVAKGNMGPRGTLTVRHHAGKLRTDMTMTGLPVPALMLVDLTARMALVYMPLPGSPGAIEVPLDEGGLGPMGGEGTKIGTSTVASEPCDLWRMDSHRSSGQLVACITADGIHLLTQVTVDGTPQVVMELTEVAREPQDERLFALPPGIPVIRR